MKTKKMVLLSSLILGLCLYLSSCQKDRMEPTRKALPVYTEWRDIDNDGQLDLIIGFNKVDLERLEQKNVTLKGYFPNTDTRFVTDPFIVQP